MVEVTSVTLTLAGAAEGAVYNHTTFNKQSHSVMQTYKMNASMSAFHQLVNYFQKNKQSSHSYAFVC